MKKIFFVLIIALTLMLASCATPDAENAEDSPASPSAEATDSADVLRGLIAQYKSAGDHQALYETAIKLIALDPTDTDAYLIAIDALDSMSKANYEEINRLLAQGGENAQDIKALAEWVKQNEPEYSLSMPFVSDYVSADEVNADGITTGNMTNGAKYNGCWTAGLLTWQGDWVYLSRPDENFAIYKMCADGSEYQRIGEENGSSLNIIGDWIYYINYNDGSKVYKIRTDGSMKTKLCDDECEFLSVAGEWMFYHNGSDGGCLYRLKTDGSEKRKLVDAMVMFPCVADGYVYYTEKRENSCLYRIPIDGGEPGAVIDSGLQSYSLQDENGAEISIELTTDAIQTYCVWEDWLYFFDMNNPYSIRRVHTDGTGYELVWPFDFSIATLNIAGGKLACSFWYQKHYEEDGFYLGEEIATFDLETLEKELYLEADTEPI